jgi:4-hydroxy-2-oxoglutarate aldolase
VGVIDSGSPCERIAQTRAAARREFTILAGTDDRLWQALKAGVDGAALWLASAAPYAAIAIWEAFRRREDDAALDWQARISRPSILVTEKYGVPGLKHAMDLNGYYGGPPRLPLIPVSASGRVEIEEAFCDLKG